MLALFLLALALFMDAFAAALSQGATPAKLAGWTLFTCAVATSIDAAAAGLTLPTLSVPILPAVAVIGATTFVLSWGGVLAGRGRSLAGPLCRGGGRADPDRIGLKIFIQHQFLGR